MKKFVLALLFMGINFLNAQSDYSLLLIPENLKENANSIIREQNIEITIVSINKMIINKYKVITVFNYNGLKNIDAVEYYDKSTSVNSIQAIVYDTFGNEIKKINWK